MEEKNEGEFELLKVKEVAALLQLSVSGVRELQTKRKITFYRVGGAIRFDKRDVLDYLKRRVAPPIL